MTRCVQLKADALDSNLVHSQVRKPWAIFFFIWGKKWDNNSTLSQGHYKMIYFMQNTHCLAHSMHLVNVS